MRIIAIDPGDMSGVAEIRKCSLVGAGEVAGGSVGVLDFVWNASEDLHNEPIDLIVCEAYIVTASTIQKSRQYSPLESIGGLRWMASRWNIPFKLQTPAQAKKFSTNDKLKTLGWYYATPGGHANDALRHLLLAAVETPAYRQKLLAQLVDPVYNKRRIARED